MRNEEEFRASRPPEGRLRRAGMRRLQPVLEAGPERTENVGMTSSRHHAPRPSALATPARAPGRRRGIALLPTAIARRPPATCRDAQARDRGRRRNQFKADSRRTLTAPRREVRNEEPCLTRSRCLRVWSSRRAAENVGSVFRIMRRTGAAAAPAAPRRR